MKTPAEELSELMDVGGLRLGPFPKYTRRYPMPVELAMRGLAEESREAAKTLRLTVARELLDRLEIGRPVIVPRGAVATIKQAARERGGIKIQARKIDAESAQLTRVL